MKKILVLIACFSILSAYAQYSDEDVTAYIARYSSIAEHSMKTYKIPASIKLAQAIYATNAGQSKVAVEANNHFGLLCKQEYAGAKYYETSDRSGDCFRMYSTVEASYMDHDFFLTQRSRYALLFKLEINDYKAWANGLQLCGYSANPSYAQRLISIIEKYDLTRFDKIEPATPVAQTAATTTTTVANTTAQATAAPTSPTATTTNTSTQAAVAPTTPATTAAVATAAVATTAAVAQTAATPQPVSKSTTTETINGIEVIYNDSPSAEQKQAQQQKQVQEQSQVQEQKQVQEPDKPKITKEPVVRTNVFKAKDLEYKVAYFPYTRRNVYENNKVKFIIAKEGDTYGRIAYDVALPESSLREYNDAYDEYEPEDGEVVYLQMKSTKAEVKFHVLSEGDTFRYLSQKYGIQLRTIIKRNPQPSKGFCVGDVICVDCK